jgi:hypothetical protein
MLLNNTDLADILDLRFDVLENDPVTGFHGAKCEGLAPSTDYCDFIADGANLCAQAHSSTWFSFVACMYSVADPDKDGDAKNPLAHSASFDTQLTTCSKMVPDYNATALSACTYGSEAQELRKVSAAKTPEFHGPQWIIVDGKLIPSPTLPDGRPDEKAPRGPWVKQVIQAICAAYAGPKPRACSQAAIML